MVLTLQEFIWQPGLQDGFSEMRTLELKREGCSRAGIPGGTSQPERTRAMAQNGPTGGRRTAHVPIHGSRNNRVMGPAGREQVQQTL